MPGPSYHGRTHIPGGTDPIPGLFPSLTGGTLDQLIAAQSPSGFWKLDESSGHVAADSSGNGKDLSTSVGLELDPLWGAAAGPPGTLAADFDHGTSGLGGTAARVSRSWPSMTSNFTAGIWVNPGGAACLIMGQGNPGRGGTIGGWQIAYSGSPNYFLQVRAAGLSPAFANSDNSHSAGTYAFVAVTKSGTTWKLYIDGLLQTSTLSGSYTASGTSPLWIGHDGGLGSNAIEIGDFVGSYGFLMPVALTGSQVLAINTAATVGPYVAAGRVLTSDGAGAATWEKPTIEVTY